MYKVYYEVVGYVSKIAIVCAENESQAKHILENQYLVGVVKVTSIHYCQVGDVVFIDGRY
jgi:hypothetical protein